MNTPTGEQFDLTRAHANYQAHASISELAAGLRGLSVGGVELIEGYGAHDLVPYAAGIVLVPWPNRIEDGRWQYLGQNQQLDLTEPSRYNAIHGLLRNTVYRVLERSDDAITLGAAIYPQHGYPFELDTSVRYELVDDGLTVTHQIENTGTDAAPVAIGAHPYLRLGDVPTAELTLTLAATTHFTVDDRLNPIREDAVAGTAFDFQAGARVGKLMLDDGFGGVAPGLTHRLTAVDGRFVEVWSDPEFAYVQVFTNPIFPRDGQPTLAIAVEPMTAPANAFNSGAGLRWLESGERWSVAWGIRYSG
ncbi:MAG: aldose 1-epimerase family protein [Microbacteriaceae bacterium]|nr:aldose 1-epimerase family protein [Microbacteriaceae bacterium]